MNEKILSELKKNGIPNYQFLSNKSSLKLYPGLLEKLLTKAEKNLEKILEKGQKAKKPLTFSSVIEPYFQNDTELSNLYSFISSLNSTDSNEFTRKIIQNFQPKLVAYSNKTSLNPKFYEILKKIKLTKNPRIKEQKRSIELLLKSMEVAGVHVSNEKREELEEINQKLALLSEKFENNTIDSRKEFFHEFFDDNALKELPKNDLEDAKMEAKNKKTKAKYVFTLSPPSVQAILKYCSDRKIRELFYKKSQTIATQKKWDNRPIILQILKLRRKKAKLLGFKNYAEYVLQERMATNVKEISTMLSKIFKKAHKKSKQEIEELKKFSGLKKLEEWDISYYSEKLRQKNFGIDDKELRSYFPLEKVLQGLFDIISKLFDITLKEIKTATYSDDVRTFEVFQKDQLIAYYVADFSARPSKRGGAWCNIIKNAELENKKYIPPVVINVMNFSKIKKGNPVLLTHRDTETLFHEFGHALHVILSSKTYNNLTGFHTEWDFVEFPSQLLENWCWEQQALNLFTSHYKSKKKLPLNLIEKLKNSKTFMSGLRTIRQLEFGFLDLALHTKNPPKTVKELDSLCQKVAQTYCVLKKFPKYRMYTSFGHIFAGGYAAGYYSYIWAEILEADAYQFIKSKGILTPSIGRKYAETILAPGAKESGMQLFKNFMKRGPSVVAFMKKHQL